MCKKEVNALIIEHLEKQTRPVQAVDLARFVRRSSRDVTYVEVQEVLDDLTERKVLRDVAGKYVVVRNNVRNVLRDSGSAGRKTTEHAIPGNVLVKEFSGSVGSETCKIINGPERSERNLSRPSVGDTQAGVTNRQKPREEMVVRAKDICNNNRSTTVHCFTMDTAVNNVQKQHCSDTGKVQEHLVTSDTGKVQEHLVTSHSPQVVHGVGQQQICKPTLPNNILPQHPKLLSLLHQQPSLHSITPPSTSAESAPVCPVTWYPHQPNPSHSAMTSQIHNNINYHLTTYPMCSPPLPPTSHNVLPPRAMVPKHGVQEIQNSSNQSYNQQLHSNENQHLYSNSNHHLYSNSNQQLYSNSNHHLYSNSNQHLYSNSNQHLYSNSNQHLYSNSNQHLYSNSNHHLYSNSNQHLYSNSNQHLYSNSNQHLYSNSNQHLYSNNNHHREQRLYLSCNYHTNDLQLSQPHSVLPRPTNSRPSCEKWSDYTSATMSPAVATHGQASRPTDPCHSHNSQQRNRPAPYPTQQHLPCQLQYPPQQPKVLHFRL